MLQRMALQQLHGDKRTPFEFSDIVNCAKVWMIQRGCRARFAPESLDSLRVVGNVFGKNLQRHIPAKPRVLGLIKDAHAATAKGGLNGVLRVGASDDRRSVGRS